MARLIPVILAAVPLLIAGSVGAHEGEEHGASSETGTMLEQMREMHEGHEHLHDFEAIEALSSDEMEHLLQVLLDIGLVVPSMDPQRGRELFLSTGCIVCHQINSVGGEIGPSLSADEMPIPMNAFEFAARMWRGAGAMIAMQQDLFGDQIELTGQDLADLVAFAHDADEQSKVTADDVPGHFRSLIEQ